MPVEEATRMFKDYLRAGERPAQIPGAIEVVNRLIEEYPVVIFTTHPVDLLEEEARMYGLAPCLFVSDVSKKHRCEPLEKQIEGINKDRVIYVGDTQVDVELANSYQLVSVALAHEHSYHNQISLEQARPKHLIHSLGELPQLVNKILGETVA